MVNLDPQNHAWVMEYLFGRERPESGQTRILITGGRGYIGSALIKNLFDNVPSGCTLYDWSIEKDLVNLEDLAGVRKVLKDFQPHIVYHLAAFADVDGCEKNPLEATTSNYKGTWNLLTAIEQECKSRPLFIYTSTMQVLGDRRADYWSTYDPKSNPSNPRQTNAYAYTKWMAELLVESYHKAWGSDQWGIVRLGNVYGPGSRCVIDRWIEHYKAGRPLPIAESNTGSPVRTYVHIDAVATALRVLPNLILTGYTGQPYYLGGQTRDLMDLQRSFNRWADRKYGRLPEWAPFKLPQYQPGASHMMTSKEFRQIVRDFSSIGDYLEKAF